MGTNDRSVQFAGDTLGRQRHICAFFNSVDEEHRVLRSFIKEGLDRGEKAFHIVDPELREDHLKRLTEAGVSVERAMGSGQLEVRPWQHAYLHHGRPLYRVGGHRCWCGFGLFHKLINGDATHSQKERVNHPEGCESPTKFGASGPTPRDLSGLDSFVPLV
jgi:hypothetical protein